VLSRFPARRHGAAARVFGRQFFALSTSLFLAIHGIIARSF